MSSLEVCPVCVITVTSDSKGVMCDDSCKRWFHAACVKLSAAEYTKLANDVNRKWECGRDDCINVANQPLNMLVAQLSSLSKNITVLSSKVDTLISLPTKVDQIIADVSRLNNNIESLNDRVTSNEERIRNLESLAKNQTLGASSSNPEMIMAEMNDRSRRSSNVMVYNLPESASSNVDIRKTHDSDLVYEFLKSFVPSFSGRGLKTSRIGKKHDGKPRPLKVFLNTDKEARDILSKFPHDSSARSGTQFASVSIGRDRTPQEQKYLKSLKEELKQRELEGEKNLTIKFKNNIPSIVKISKND